MVVDSKENLRDSLRSFVSKEGAVASLEAQIKSWNVYQIAETLGFYIPMKDELSVEFLFASGKQIYLPRYKQSSGIYEMAHVESDEQLVAGKYGILEPANHCKTAAKNEIELWFIPGVAFSRQGHRLGRGAGFYDRLLAGEGGVKAGICSSQRILQGIPLEAHDITMDFVLTDNELIEIK